MRPLRYSVFAILAFAVLCLAWTRASAQSCTPATCGPSFQTIDFESIPTGATVEGLGAIHPDLNITSQPWAFGPSCPIGMGVVIEEGNPVPFNAWGSPGGFGNDCVNGVKGFGDSALCVLDYDFTFAPGVVVSCFGLRMFDYGDFFPFGGTTHQVFLTAYDAGNVVVDQFVLTVLGGVAGTGDACSLQPGSSGNTLMTVSGPGIVKVQLTFDAFPDPNVGYDDVRFCEEAPTRARPGSWGTVKTIYR